MDDKLMKQPEMKTIECCFNCKFCGMPEMIDAFVCRNKLAYGEEFAVEPNNKCDLWEDEKIW